MFTKYFACCVAHNWWTGAGRPWCRWSMSEGGKAVLFYLGPVYIRVGRLV